MTRSIIRIKDTVGSFRLDPECYQEKYIQAESAVLKCHHTTIKRIEKSFKKGIFDIKAESYVSTGIPFVRISDLRNAIIETSNIAHIPQNIHIENIKTALYRNDIVLSKTAYPAASLVTVEECNTSQDTIAFKTKLDSGVNNRYLVTFLNCKYGMLQMERWFTGNIQSHLNLDDSRGILIPILSSKFQDLIDGTFKLYLESIHKSSFFMINAMDALLEELDMKIWNQPHILSYSRRFSDSVKAGRLDAEYFQPQYTEIENLIKSYHGGFSYIGKEFKQNKSRFIKDKDALYNYVEISSINVNNGEITPLVVYGSELPDNAKRVLLRDDVIISKVRTYRGAITIVEEDGLVGSGAFTILHENGRINKETLLAFLHSKPMLAWSLKPSTGTSYPVIIDDDILNMPIPLVPDAIQEDIKENINNSFKLRKKSKHMLECAKRAVEIAIEQDEQIAINWLKEQVGEDYAP